MVSQFNHQLELTPSSRKITTFTTHAGLCRFKQFNHSTNSAAEIFQNKLQLIHGIAGVRNIADDNTVFGSNYEEHNKASRAYLLRLETHGLTLNMGKCKFLKQNLEFLGMIFSTGDVCPDPKKISVFVNTTTPSTLYGQLQLTVYLKFLQQ